MISALPALVADTTQRYLIPAGPLAAKLGELERAQARMRDTTIASLQHKLAQIETFLKNDNRWREGVARLGSEGVGPGGTYLDLLGV